MKCLECGGRTTTRREEWKYTASGLPNVTLAGVPIARCRDCGETEVTIPAIAELHALIARVLVLKPARLTSHEARFLRKHLGFSGVDAAAVLGVSASALSRWENGKDPIGRTTDKLLRSLVERREPIEKYEDELPKIAAKPARAARIGLRHWRGWHEAQVPA